MEQVVTALQALLKYIETFFTPRVWAKLKLQTDWGAYVVNFAANVLVFDAAYVVDPLGRVELRGWVQATLGSNAVITQLPPEARPKLLASFPAVCFTGLLTTVLAHVAVGPDGLVVVYAPALGAGDAISLDGIRFDTRV
jgi:hypothetical protein